VLGLGWITLLIVGFALFGLAFLDLLSDALRAAAGWGAGNPHVLAAGTGALVLTGIALSRVLRRRAPSPAGDEPARVRAMETPAHPVLRGGDQALRPDVWPLLGSAGSGALLAGAFAFEIFGGLPPCPLCIDQRWAHVWPLIAGIALFALYRFGPALPGLAVRAGSALMAGLFAFATWRAVRHAGLEYRLLDTRCPAADMTGVTLEDVMAQMDTPQVLVACDEVYWSLFGISMAGYNVLFSGALCAISLIVLFRKPARSAS